MQFNRNDIKTSNEHVFQPRYISYWRVAGILMLGTITAGSLAPTPPFMLNPVIPYLDKVLHFVAYSLITSWYLAVFPVKRRWSIPVMLMGFGLWIEWLQELTDYRVADITDAFANLGGIVVAARFLVRPMRQAIMEIESIIDDRTAARRRTPPRTLRHLVLWRIIIVHLGIGLLLFSLIPSEIETPPSNYVSVSVHYLIWGTLAAGFVITLSGRKHNILIPASVLTLTIGMETLLRTTQYDARHLASDLLIHALTITLTCVIVISPLKMLLLQIEYRLSPPPRRRRRRRRKAHSH